MSAPTQAEQAALNLEAVRRVRSALTQIEEAQNKLNDACATLSSLQHAMPEWRATSQMADKVKAHWYKVQNSLYLGSKASRVRLDPLATDGVLARLRGGTT